MHKLNLIPLLLACLALAGCAPTEKSAAAPVLISFQEGSQFEITTPDGTRILIDVVNPAALSQPPAEKDVLLITHAHRDHFNAAFADAFPGQQLRFQEGKIQLADASIQGIVAGHNAGDKLDPEHGTDYIYIIDTGGLRIVLFGDIGQETLTDEQLAALGQVDVACMQLSNSYSAMNLDNKKGFNLMDQVKPRLIIPTHHDLDTAQYAVEKWSGYYWDQKVMPLTPDQLPAETRVLFMGSASKGYGKMYSIPAWGE